MTARRSLGGIAALAALLALGACAMTPSAGPPETLRTFGPDDRPIATSGCTAADGGWQVQRDAAGSVPLFEVTVPDLERSMLTYRARLRARDVTGKAYLEMWVRVPGRGEFFSRGVQQPLEGTTEWASYEIPFFLNEKGVRADLVKLNVAFEGGGGTVWIKDIGLLRSSLG